MSDFSKTIKISSTRFNEVEVSEDKIINAPEGIIGFPEHRRYVLLDPSGGKSIFLWLQSVDTPDLAFILTDPTLFVPDYQILLSEPDVARLGVENRSKPALFVIVTVPQDDPDNSTINLLAPLLYFADENEIFQILLEKGNLPIRYPILKKESAGKPLEEERVRTDEGVQ